MRASNLPALLTTVLAVIAIGCSGAPPDEREAPQRLCQPPGNPHTSGEIVLTRVFPEVRADSLVGLAWEPRSDGFVVLDQRGRLVRYDAEGRNPETILDWADRVMDPWGPDHGETGLIGFALHPDWPDDGRVWVSAVLNEGVPEQCPMQIVAELRRADGASGLQLDPEPARILFERRNECWRKADGGVHPVHHGGTLHFDPDDSGRLIVGFGEMNRPADAGRPDRPEGTFLAFHVDQDGASTLPGVLAPAEVLAWGFRNPWKWSFDRETGALWLGDVGGRRFEEIHRLGRGEHHGWPVLEAAACTEEPCDPESFRAPEYWYDRGGGCSVIGGYVYRGAMWPDLQGVYLFSDFCNGRISGLFASADGSLEERLLAHTEFKISSFAEDRAGEVYALSIRGEIYRLDHYQDAEDSLLPETLAETGCTADNETDLLPYDVEIPLWSDGAAKRRWLSLPPGAAIGIDEHGDLEFPPGTVFAKEFSFDGRPVETRLLSRHADGGWNGVSYAWDEDGRTARLVESQGRTAELPAADGLAWRFPGRQECLRCHSVHAGRTLGAELAQLRAADGGPDPVESMIASGALDAQRARAIRDAVRFPSWSAPSAGARDEEAALGGYLHANCSFCHAPDGIARTDIDLRFPHWPADSGVCDREVRFGVIPVDHLLRLTPGDAERSALWWRMQDTGEHRMPPLATSLVDERATSRLRDWIEGLDRCPEAAASPASFDRHSSAP